MSILNVDKIQPIGGGSTITVDATDIQATSATITASKFVGSGDLSVTGVSTFTGDVIINGDELFIADSIKHVGDTDTLISFPSNDTIRFNTAGSERLRITSAGRIGINETSPDIDLHIKNTNPAIILEGTNGSGRQHKIWSAGTNSESLQFTSGNLLYNADVHYFRASNETTEYLRITSGNVGIASAIPSEKLDVTGNIKASGTVTGSSFVGGLPITSGADNRVITASSATAIQGESTLTYDGTMLFCNGGTITAERGAIPSVEAKNSTTSSYARFYCSQTSGSGGYAAFQKLGTTSTAIGGANATQIWCTGDAPLVIGVNGGERLRIDSTGRLLLGAGAIALPKGSAAGSFDLDNGNITMCIGGNSNSTGRTNSTDKINRITSPHYTNAEEPVALISSYNVSNQNIISYGGGSGQTNAVTKHSFYTAGNTTTTTGTERLIIDSSGLLGLNVTPSYSGLFGGSQKGMHIGGTTAPFLRITSSTSGQGDLILQAGNSGSDVQMGNLTAAGDITFWTKPSGGSTTERLRIKDDGIIQCGTSGVLKAEINNAVSGHYFVSQCSDNNNGFEIYQQHGSTTTRNTLAVYDNRTGSKSPSFIVRGDGKVAINRTSPAHHLDVDSTSLFRNFAYFGSGGVIKSTAFSGGSAYDTGLSVNAHGYGAGMVFIASQNYNAGTGTRAGLYYVKFYYDGNNSAVTYHIAGDNWVTFGKSGSNTLTVTFGAGNNMFTYIGSSLNIT